MRHEGAEDHPYTIQLRLASENAGSPVFYEKSMIYIDGSGSGWTGANSNLKCVAPGDANPWPLP